MTKFLNESGFRRIIKTIKDALAGKQDKKLVVTATSVGSDNITANKTYNEILSAYNSGADILVDDGYGYFYHLIAFDSGWFVFMMKPYDETNSDYYLLVSPQNVWTSRTWVAQEKLVSGTNIKTINNTSLLGSGNISIEPNEIASINTTESTASGGNNTVTINTTNGTSKTFNVKNGKDGADGVSLGEIALVQTTGDSEQSVMSQKAVTEYGRKVTAEDLNGTSEWIRAKLTAEGWEFGKYVASNGSLGTDANFCASFFIPMDMSTRKGHSITFGYMFNAWNGTNFAWYNGSKTFVSGLYYYCNEDNARTIIISASNTWDNAAYIRMTCNPNRLNECYILDNTTGEYIFKGDEYLVPYNNNNITYGLLENSVIAQELGNSATKVGSQKMITDSINYNTNIESAEGFTLNSGANCCYLILTPKATTLLNASDKMTFMFSTKGTGNLADYRYFLFGNGSLTTNNPDSNGAFVAYSYSRNLSVNRVSYTLNRKDNTNIYPTPDVWIVTWDRINGIVNFYDHTTLVNTLSGDSYKKERFVNDEGKIAIMGGDNNTRIYDIRLFDYDISYLFGNSDISSEINNLCGAGILPSQFLNNYNNSDGLFITETNNFQGRGYNATCTYSLDGDDFHIVVKDGVSTTQICGGKPYYLGVPYKAQLEKIEFEVVSGVIKLCWRIKMLEEGLNYYTIIDSNGNEISDYNNIGIGKYTLIRTQSSTGARFNFYKVSGNVEVVINRNMKYKPISCVFHLRGDTMYNKKFYDDQTNSFITLYTNHTCSMEYTDHTLVKTPQRVIRTEINNLNGLPHYAGEMAVVGNNVYIGMPDYTWKQINNS